MIVRASIDDCDLLLEGEINVSRARRGASKDVHRAAENVVSRVVRVRVGVIEATDGDHFTVERETVTKLVVVVRSVGSGETG